MARMTIEQLLAQTRAGLIRFNAHDLHAALLNDEVDKPIVLDTRTPTDRERFGCIPGAIHTPRTLLEFIVDPDWGFQHAQIVGFDQQLVCVCNGGFSSSLAAASLQRIGFLRATDLEGGMEAWRNAGLPVEPPDYVQFD
jgi:rhodanese-related sulfurtransferase